MEADWEVEIGGGAPVIEAPWPGFIDLRKNPAAIRNIAEAAEFPPLSALLLALNTDRSPLWTSKCDLWEPTPAAMASYIDLLPTEGQIFSEWQHAETFCRQYVANLTSAAPLECTTSSNQTAAPECSILLVIRGAIVHRVEGFGITAYLSVSASSPAAASAAIAAMMAVFADALPPATPPPTPVSKLQ